MRGSCASCCATTNSLPFPALLLQACPDPATKPAPDARVCGVSPASMEHWTRVLPNQHRTACTVRWFGNVGVIWVERSGMMQTKNSS